MRARAYRSPVDDVPVNGESAVCVRLVVFVAVLFVVVRVGYVDREDSAARVSGCGCDLQAREREEVRDAHVDVRLDGEAVWRDVSEEY